MNNRREFLHTAVTGWAASMATGFGQVAATTNPWAGEIGITTGSFTRHLSIEPRPGKIRLLDLPRLMRDELGMRVMDLMTATLPSLLPGDLDQLRAAAESAGCILTNLKMNQPGLEMASPDEPTRRRALAEYQRTMTAAAHLGVRWVRPLPGPRRPGLKLLAAACQELAAYGRPLGLGILIENFGWIKDDPLAIPAVIQAAGPSLRSQPDTGNWTDAARYDGLARAFPFAASCDFKALTLTPEGAHPAYDLRRCFQIGWDAGFRGPWCLEHTHPNLPTLLQELRLLRDQLRQWIAAA